MKILEEKPWSVVTTCTAAGNSGNGCGSKLEVELSDLVYYEGVPGEIWGSRDPALCFKCIVCGAINDIKSKDYPQRYGDFPRWSKSWEQTGIVVQSNEGDSK